MIRIVKRLKNGIEDYGGIVSNDFKKFCREFKTDFKKELAKIGGTNYKQNNGHYYISAFFTYKDKCYYISLSDCRYFSNDSLLIRECKDYKDYTGGTNNYIDIKDNMLVDYFRFYN